MARLPSWTLKVMGPHSEAADCSPPLISPACFLFLVHSTPLSTEIAAHAEIGWPALSPPLPGSQPGRSSHMEFPHTSQVA